MTRLLGLPLEDRAKLRAWTDHAMRMSGGLATSEELAQSAAETQHFQAYLDERFEAELAHPGEEVMGDLARAVREGQGTTAGLERWEAVAILFQLVVGAIETTVGLIGAALQHAAQTPDACNHFRSRWADARVTAAAISAVALYSNSLRSGVGKGPVSPGSEFRVGAFG